jgi:hypothetical protein
LYLLINKLYIYHLIDHNESFDLFLFFEKKKKCQVGGGG